MLFGVCQFLRLLLTWKSCQINGAMVKFLTFCAGAWVQLPGLTTRGSPWLLKMRGQGYMSLAAYKYSLSLVLEDKIQSTNHTLYLIVATCKAALSFQPSSRDIL